MESAPCAIYRIDARTDGPSRARRIVERELAAVLPEGALYAIRCAVIDHGSGVLATRKQGEVGWGWKLVEELATRWGFASSQDGTQVWFEAVGANAAV